VKGPLHISYTVLALIILSVVAMIGGIGILVASIFWMTSVMLPLGIGALLGGWLLLEKSMERIARDNGMAADR
jgi:hypothetical protein